MQIIQEELTENCKQKVLLDYHLENFLYCFPNQADAKLSDFSCKKASAIVRNGKENVD